MSEYFTCYFKTFFSPHLTLDSVDLYHPLSSYTSYSNCLLNGRGHCLPCLLLFLLFFYLNYHTRQLSLFVFNVHASLVETKGRLCLAISSLVSSFFLFLHHTYLLLISESLSLYTFLSSLPWSMHL